MTESPKFKQFKYKVIRLKSIICKEKYREHIYIAFPLKLSFNAEYLSSNIQCFSISILA